MGGWNIFYGLLNFAILAAALYFIGWKLVVKMFKSRRDRIADELEQAKQAKEKAENIRAGLDKARAGGDAQGEAIIAKAKETAERSSEEARRADEKSAADIAAGARSDAEQIDYTAGCTFLKDRELHLTPIEYKLLCLLSRNVGKVLTHTYITQQIWGRCSENDVASLRVFMATLRKKLEPEKNGVQYIQTHIGIGYRMLRIEKPE